MRMVVAILGIIAVGVALTIADALIRGGIPAPPAAVLGWLTWVAGVVGLWKGIKLVDTLVNKFR